ncbi:MAG: S41 family peptidase, partial [Eubacteriales bacterium]|nr:S41 family peptidase [Eubacteriales bacterium]
MEERNRNMPEEQDLSREQPGYARRMPRSGWEDGRRENGSRGRSGGIRGLFIIFALGMAAGIVVLLAAAQILPVPISARQSFFSPGSGASAGGSAVNDDSIEKLRVLEQCINEYYYAPEEVTVEGLETGMYKGIMDSLGDPYTVYYTEEEYKDLTEDTSGVYKGIGAYIGLDSTNNVPTFTGIMPGTPAEKAGLKVGDIICEVDGTDTLSMSTAEVAKRVKGEEGTQVEIKVQRDGEYMTFTVTRATINVPTVSSEMRDNGVGYLQISQFDDVTPNQFNENLAQLKKDGMKSLIIDLRDNPGGTVSAVTQIASELLPQGLIFYMEDKNGKREEYKCPGADFNYPLVVLVNEYSASASEILAGAIQDAGIGTLVGTQTYGKGIVQNLYPLGDGSAIKITVADYYTRAGRNIHKVGIEPDCVVELDKEKYEEENV